MKKYFSHSFRKPFQPVKDTGKTVVFSGALGCLKGSEVFFERQCARDHVTGGIFSVMLDFLTWLCLGCISFDWNGFYHFGSELSV